MGLTFDAPTHVYTLDDEVVPSVTGVLKASGLIDFSRIPPHILEAARTRGTKVHQALHYLNENDLDVEQFYVDFPHYAGYVQSWVSLLATRRLKTLACEIRVASRRHRFAGTIDWIGEMDGRGTILDFATGSPEDVAKDLQTAGYHIAGREWAEHDPRLASFFARYPVIDRVAVRLKKTGGLPSLAPYREPRHFNEFLTLVAARRIVESRKGETAAWAEAA